MTPLLDFAFDADASNEQRVLSAKRVTLRDIITVEDALAAAKWEQEPVDEPL